MEKLQTQSPSLESAEERLAKGVIDAVREGRGRDPLALSAKYNINLEIAAHLLQQTREKMSLPIKELRASVIAECVKMRAGTPSPTHSAQAQFAARSIADAVTSGHGKEYEQCAKHLSISPEFVKILLANARNSQGLGIAGPKLVSAIALDFDSLQSKFTH